MYETYSKVDVSVYPQGDTRYTYVYFQTLFQYYLRINCYMQGPGEIPPLTLYLEFLKCG